MVLTWKSASRGLLRAGVTAVVLAAMGYSSPPTVASDPFEELRQRIEQLEEDNRELRTAMVPKQTLGIDVAPIPPAPEETEPPSEDDKHIESVIEKYLQRRPTFADSTQDQSISALQSNVSGILDRLNKKTYPTVQINGVFQADVGFFSQDENSKIAYGTIQNGSDFRRARLSAKGSLTETTNYFFQMDFAFFGRPTFTDVWVEQTQIPGLGTVRVGQWKQPFSLEVVSSFRYTTFVERSSLFQAFTPFRHLGAGFYNNAQDLSSTWAMSVFQTGQDQFGGTVSTAGGWGTAERITYLPYYDEASKGREYLHLGLGHYFNAPPDKKTIFRSIPEMYIGANAPGTVGSSGQAAHGGFNGTPFFVNTGNIGVNCFNVLGTEVLWVNGPFSFQSEAMVNLVDQAAHVTGTLNTAGGSMAVLPGVYAQTGYFLTGEHRPYDRKAGAIDRVIPQHNFGPWNGDCGWGAWEVAGRYSYIDLNDQNIRGGQMSDYTAGLNWYLNPYWKIQFNYIYSASNFRYAAGGAATNTPAPPFLGNHTSMFDLRCQMDF
ncbi:MAG: porin [Planctomycetaceae bacterium]